MGMAVDFSRTAYMIFQSVTFFFILIEIEGLVLVLVTVS